MTRGDGSTRIERRREWLQIVAGCLCVTAMWAGMFGLAFIMGRREEVRPAATGMSAPAFAFGPVTWTTEAGFTRVRGEATNTGDTAKLLFLWAIEVTFYDRAGREVGRVAGFPEEYERAIEPGETRTYAGFALIDVSGAVRYTVGLTFMSGPGSAPRD